MEKYAYAYTMVRYSNILDIAEAVIMTILIYVCFNKYSFRLKTKTQCRLTGTTHSPKTSYMP